MMYAMKSSHSTVLLLAVSMLFPVTAVQSMPSLLTISRVQQAIQSAPMKDADTTTNPKLDSPLEYLVSTTTTNEVSAFESTQADPAVSHVRKSSGMDNLIYINKNNEVVVDVLGQTSPGKTLESVLLENGYSVINCFMNQCSINLHIDSIEAITKLPEVLKINLALHSVHHTPTENRIRQGTTSHQIRRNLIGSVLSEATKALFVDTARNRYSNLDGTNITVGIISDSFDCNDSQAEIDIQTGDLPPLSRINVLADLEVGDENYRFCVDAGRAMMQLVYDIAPGVNFVFRTAARGQADFAAGIIELADAGCQIIVDDLVYFAEPFFQDGIIALAINEVVSRGVHYFTPAGNGGGIAWDGTKGFVDSSIKALNSTSATFHSFGLDKNGSHIVLQPFITQRVRFSSVFLFQWDEPYISPKGNGGSRSDLDIYVFDEAGKVLSTPPRNDTGSNPYDFVFYDTINATSTGNTTTVVVYVAIVLKNGPPPTYMKIIPLDDGVFNFSTGTEATCRGHRNLASAAAVGASYYMETPAFGVSPPIVEYYSSYGGIPIFFDGDSNRLPVPEIRQQPRFTGPDGVSTTFFEEPDKTFFGATASATAVAGVAALMLQLQAKSSTKVTPEKLFQILESTAIDMTSTVGFDYITGYGYVNASSALDAVAAMIVTKTPTKSPTKSPTAAPVSSPTKCGLFGFNFFCPARGECGFFRRLFNINGC